MNFMARPISTTVYKYIKKKKIALDESNGKYEPCARIPIVHVVHRPSRRCRTRRYPRPAAPPPLRPPPATLTDPERGGKVNNDLVSAGSRSRFPFRVGDNSEWTISLVSFATALTAS
ncbi:hypothetical protein EVAR_87859_1 [Eumeta japonica]|uniref:Uncharacterized protein n=1 Tax=Eumeta variegata TaxID=151549 RepID=A0A4C1WXE7_EUMVA|nr:hypothetical protein EVAR_87859_1 [Eumeta japonica]